MGYKTIPVKYNVFHDSDNPIFGDSILSVSIDDDVVGPYLEIEQNSDENQGKIHVDMGQIDALVDLLQKLKGKWKGVRHGTTHHAKG